MATAGGSAARRARAAAAAAAATDDNGEVAPFKGCFLGTCTPFLERSGAGSGAGAGGAAGAGAGGAARGAARRCWLVRCAVARCNTTVCTEHGWGDGEKEPGCGTGLEELSYDTRKCADQSCNRHFCEQHYFQVLEECQVCELRRSVSNSYDNRARLLEVNYCDKHPVRCCGRSMRTPDDDDDEEEEREDEDSHESDSDEDEDEDEERESTSKSESEGPHCGVRCCEFCMVMHEHEEGEDGY